MKKILAFVLAVFALSACGSDAPSVEPAPTTSAAHPDRLPNPYGSVTEETNWFAWEVMNDQVGELTGPEASNLCRNYETEPQITRMIWESEIELVDWSVAERYFDSFCGLN